MSKTMNVMNLTATRRLRGVVNSSVTCLKDLIAIVKAEEKLSNNDFATIQQLFRRLEMLDDEFKTCHFAIVDLVEEETLGEEQVVLDDHDNKVLFLTERLQCLVWDTVAASPTKPTTKPSHLLHTVEVCVTWKAV